MRLEDRVTRGDFLKVMRRYGKGLAGLWLLSNPILLAACEESEPRPITSEQISLVLSRETAEVLRERIYLWRSEQLAAVRIKEPPVSKHPVTVEQKPPYYNGPEPLKYISYKQVGVIGADVNTVILDDYGPFKNYYIYDPPLTLKGAQTVDEKGRILAEAILDYPSLDTINTKEARWYLREVHYNRDERAQFAARIELDSSGNKTKELIAVGTKRGEFYFSFPILS